MSTLSTDTLLGSCGYNGADGTPKAGALVTPPKLEAHSNWVPSGAVESVPLRLASTTGPR